MLSIGEAISAVLREAAPRPAVSVTIEEALGLALAEDVASDTDSPPYDKSIVDGYAVVAEDLRGGSAELEIIEEVVAGAVPTRSVLRGMATRIMTGAPLPHMADAVVMVERSEVISPSAGARLFTFGSLGRVRLSDGGVSPGQNILRRGVALRRGTTVLTRGRRLRPVDVGLLAEVGRAKVLATPRPRVAVLATGNELVAAGQPLDQGKIRNSNGPMLAACARKYDATPIDLGVAKDEVADLRHRIRQGLSADVLVLSGGVSAGVLDLVPQVLEELGVERIFHKIRLRPGKPLWFGVKRDGDTPRLVFGLPGNPVSGLVCFELFVRAALLRLAARDPAPRNNTARLVADYTHRGERTTFHPAILRGSAEGNTIEPLPWQGSSDLFTATAANALCHFPPGEKPYTAGEWVDVWELD